MRPRAWLPLLLLSLVGPARAADSPRLVQFNKDISPILSDACFAYHGPDKNKRKAELRLDTDEGAFADLGGYRALVPGKPVKSELFRRITEKDPKRRMPPAGSGKALSARQVALLKAWIEQGARWQKHWA